MVTIKTLELQHVSTVVQVHLRAFPNFFLSFLGERFLREFYTSFISDSQGLAFVAVDADGRVRGVIVGALNPSGYYKRLLLRRWWAFSLASISALLHRPTIAVRLIRAVCYRGEAPIGPVRALLSSVAVDPQAQGTGLGRRLVDNWTSAVRAEGIGGCYLATDAVGNDAVNCFYKKLGWRLDSNYITPEGRQMNRYTYDF
jgi:GNAT superfamily N-acetyltransferase